MTESDDRHDLAALRERLAASRDTLARLPVSGERHAGPADPSTGESWHRGNVLGHVSEMLPYWTDQFRSAIAGSGKVGRDDEGRAHRRHGIDHGDAATEADLRRSIDEGIGGALELMAVMAPGDLEIVVVNHTRDGDREATVGELLQFLIVGHVEEHLAQIAALD